VKRPLSHLLAATAALLPVAMTVLVATPAHAQFGGIVYDPTSYSQNILTAARTL
jgi:type IV secretion system protein TrbJ